MPTQTTCTTVPHLTCAHHRLTPDRPRSCTAIATATAPPASPALSFRRRSHDPRDTAGFNPRCDTTSDLHAVPHPLPHIHTYDHHLLHALETATSVRISWIDRQRREEVANVEREETRSTKHQKKLRLASRAARCGAGGAPPTLAVRALELQPEGGGTAQTQTADG